MKDTGIVRRIDELGRIVIPKEIRKNLKMTTGDNVEIYMDENRKIILKKYSTLFGMEEELFNIAKVMNEMSSTTILFTDLDKVIIAYGKDCEIYFDKYIHQNKLFTFKDQSIVQVNGVYLIPDYQETRNTLIYPFIVKNALHGFMIILENDKPISEQLKQVAFHFKKFITKQLDSK